jgi:hypothetical protein
MVNKALMARMGRSAIFELCAKGHVNALGVRADWRGGG